MNRAIRGHARSYVKRLMVLALLLPIHELLHAATCLAFGGAVLHINLTSHMVCGGNVTHIATYDLANSANELSTSLLFFAQVGRIHLSHVIAPVMGRARIWPGSL